MVKSLKKVDVKAVAKAVGKKRALALLPGGKGTDLGLPVGDVLDRLYAVIDSRKEAHPSVSHSAKLLSRGRAKVAQKFGEEAVECIIEAVAGNKSELIAESADVLYHLLVLWVDAGVAPHEVWGELQRREGVSGIAEKAARPQRLAMAAGLNTRKIP